VSKDANHLAWHTLSLPCQSNPALVRTENHAGVEWALCRDGALERLDQDMRIGRGRDSQDVDAVYESRENDTIIQGEGEQKSVKKLGLDLLRLVGWADPLRHRPRAPPDPPHVRPASDAPRPHALALRSPRPPRTTPARKSPRQPRPGWRVAPVAP